MVDFTREAEELYEQTTRLGSQKAPQQHMAAAQLFDRWCQLGQRLAKCDVVTNASAPSPSSASPRQRTALDVVDELLESSYHILAIPGIDRFAMVCSVLALQRSVATAMARRPNPCSRVSSDDALSRLWSFSWNASCAKLLPALACEIASSAPPPSASPPPASSSTPGLPTTPAAAFDEVVRRLETELQVCSTTLRNALVSIKSVSRSTAAAQAQAAHTLELEAGAATFLIGCAKVLAKKLGAALGLIARGTSNSATNCNRLPGLLSALCALQGVIDEDWAACCRCAAREQDQGTSSGRSLTGFGTIGTGAAGGANTCTNAAVMSLLPPRWLPASVDSNGSSGSCVEGAHSGGTARAGASDGTCLALHAVLAAFIGTVVSVAAKADQGGSTRDAAAQGDNPDRATNGALGTLCSALFPTPAQLPAPTDELAPRADADGCGAGASGTTGMDMGTLRSGIGRIRLSLTLVQHKKMSPDAALRHLPALFDMLALDRCGSRVLHHSTLPAAEWPHRGAEVTAGSQTAVPLQLLSHMRAALHAVILRIDVLQRNGSVSGASNEALKARSLRALQVAVLHGAAHESACCRSLVRFVMSSALCLMRRDCAVSVGVEPPAVSTWHSFVGATLSLAHGIALLAAGCSSATCEGDGHEAVSGVLQRVCSFESYVITRLPGLEQRAFLHRVLPKAWFDGDGEVSIVDDAQKCALALLQELPLVQLEPCIQTKLVAEVLSVAASDTSRILKSVERTRTTERKQTQTRDQVQDDECDCVDTHEQRLLLNYVLQRGCTLLRCLPRVISSELRSQWRKIFANILKTPSAHNCMQSRTWQALFLALPFLHGESDGLELLKSGLKAAVTLVCGPRSHSSVAFDGDIDVVMAVLSWAMEIELPSDDMVATQVSTCIKQVVQGALVIASDPNVSMPVSSANDDDHLGCSHGRCRWALKRECIRVAAHFLKHPMFAAGGAQLMPLLPPEHRAELQRHVEMSGGPGEAAAIDAMVASEREAALRLKDGTVLAKRRRTMLSNLHRVAEVDNASRDSDTTAVGRSGNFDPDHKKRREGCGTSQSIPPQTAPRMAENMCGPHGDVENENAELRRKLAHERQNVARLKAILAEHGIEA